MRKVLLLAVVMFLAMGSIANATNGYFSHGYGLKAKGMAGATTALPQDGMIGATNPAGMVFVGDRADLGVDWFSPKRHAERTGAGAISDINGSTESDSTNFFIPELAVNKMINPNASFGVVVYANGGMNTDYPSGQITSASGVGTCNNFLAMGGQATATSHNLLCGTSSLGVDLMQVVMAPTLAYKIADNHSFGISPLIGYQRFKAEGLQGFSAFSEDSSKLTNNGYDSATGLGLRVGWMSKFFDAVTVGAAYSTKIYMSKFDKYRGLFAEQGDFDMPENYSIGIAVNPLKPVTLAIDYQRINYSDVRAVGNPSTNGGSAIFNTLGGDDGRGFGWEDVNVWKFGLSYQFSEQLTIRAGYSHADNPIQSRDVTFNILAPGVVKEHYTTGFTYNVGKNSELTVAYMHAKNNSTSGKSLFNDFGVAAGDEKIEMHQNSVGLAFGVKF